MKPIKPSDAKSVHGGALSWPSPLPIDPEPKPLPEPMPIDIQPPPPEEPRFQTVGREPL